jgi:hypothetical protein
VAAGAIAEKWLRQVCKRFQFGRYLLAFAQQYQTEITAFVSAIGDIQMPEEFNQHPSGKQCENSPSSC